MKETILETVANVLKSKQKYIAEDGELLKAKVYADIMTMEPKLLRLLLSNEDIKATFFSNIDGTLVFDKQKFAWLIDSKEFLPDSYTSYTNKIGLASDREFISVKSDVVLDFPYKDCVLEGGQDKDDQKRQEIMYNETLAIDEVKNMLAPKVFTNAKRYTADGIEENIEFTDDDNLIIKGNNLIALSSLLKRYEGKVKLIYIDPPYYFNKTISEDSFKYNSNFHMSTWLTFLKNRLEIAWKLLSPDGSIWIHMGEDGMHYLKVLADDIFGKEKFVATLPRKTRDGKSDVPFNLSQDFDWILVYTKAGESDFVVGREVERKYYETDDFPGRPWRTADLTKQTTTKERPNSDFTMVNPKTGKEYPVNPKRSWAVTKETFDEYYQAGGIGFPDDYDFMSGERPFRRVFKDEDEKKEKPTAVYSDFLIRDFIESLMLKTKNKDGNDEIDALFTRDEFDYAKPENLIKNILQVTTSEHDLILDFFMGSATTQAVALKMNRRFIGIEQMDYIETVSVERLKKVIGKKVSLQENKTTQKKLELVSEPTEEYYTIEYDQGGISKDVDWQGGGSFVYCELKEDAHVLIDTIQHATEQTISNIKNDIYKDERIVPYLTTKELEDADDDFETLSLNEQKKVLLKLINKNKLYVNYADIDNADFTISESDKRFTRSFYGDKK